MAETHQLTFYRLCQQLYCIQGAKFSRVHWKCFCPFNSFSDSEVARQFDEADSSEKKQLQPLAFFTIVPPRESVCHHPNEGTYFFNMGRSRPLFGFLFYCKAFSKLNYNNCIKEQFGMTVSCWLLLSSWPGLTQQLEGVQGRLALLSLGYTSRSDLQKVQKVIQGRI